MSASTAAAPEDFDDIPGTTVFTFARARQGYRLNQLCKSLAVPANAVRFRTDQEAYVDDWGLAEAAKRALLARDYNAMIAEGGNIYFLGKLFAIDGVSFVSVAAQMTGLSPEDYLAMMLNGGRSPDGERSIREGRS